MPPSKKSPNWRKQKKIITTLMKISLKVDDYIYKGKPIVVQDAQAYMVEVANCKTKCNNDPRSLQVIEKLTRIIKNIIAEGTKSTETNEGQGNSANSYPTNCAQNIENSNKPELNPVAPFVADKTETKENNNITCKMEMVTQNQPKTFGTLKEPGNKNNNNNSQSQTNTEIQQIINEHNIRSNNSDFHISSPTYSINSDDDMIEITGNDSEVVDNNYSNDTQCVSRKNEKHNIIEVDVDFHKAMSNLSVIDNSMFQEPIECSQSILKDYSHYSLPIPILSQSQDDISSNHISCNMKTNTAFPSWQNSEKVPTDLQNQPPTNLPQTVNAVNIISTNTRKTDFNSQSVEKIIKIKKQETKVKNKKQNKVTKKQETKQKTSHSRKMVKTKTTITETKRKNSLTIEPADNKDSQDQAKKCLKVNEKFVNGYEMLSQVTYGDVRNRNVTSDQNESNASKIYNKTIECDLSWMENIRYVREIDTDEYCTLGITDQFWNNLELPINFDVREFSSYA